MREMKQKLGYSRVRCHGRSRGEPWTPGRKTTWPRQKGVGETQEVTKSQNLREGRRRWTDSRECYYHRREKRAWSNRAAETNVRRGFPQRKKKGPCGRNRGEGRNLLSHVRKKMDSVISWNNVTPFGESIKKKIGVCTCPGAIEVLGKS